MFKANLTQGSSCPGLPRQADGTNQGEVALGGQAKQGTTRNGSALTSLSVHLLNSNTDKVYPGALTLAATKSGRQARLHSVQCTQSMCFQNGLKHRAIRV